MYMQVQTLNITLPKDIVYTADFVAREEYKSRSELIKDALMKYFRDRKIWANLFAYGEKIAKKSNIKGESDVLRILDDYRNGK